MKKLYRQSPAEVAFEIINHALLIVLGMVTLYPFIFVFAASISNPLRVLAGDVLLLPKEINFDAYKIILNYEYFWIAYRNTLFYTLIGTILTNANLRDANLTNAILTNANLKGTDLTGATMPH